MIVLFVPADRPERFAKAAASGADAIIIDLEDAVAPAAKAHARAALAQLPTGVEIWVRINAAGTFWHEADVAALAGLPIAGAMLAKAENPAALQAIGVPVIALIETARGIAAARKIASAAVRLAFGSIDYAADLGMAHTREALASARAELVLASRLAGIAAPLDGVTATIDEGVEEDARHAAALGFAGKLCIHPRQITAARAGFAPSAADIAWAQRIIAAGAGGAVAVDGAMVDAPVRLRAEQILARSMM
jgi:citrate lyase subunit beta/citryl-CoA lyase